MVDRLIEERAEFPNGIKCEWEPMLFGGGRQVTVDETEARKFVQALNRKSKEQGSFIRYRSVSQD